MRIIFAFLLLIFFLNSPVTYGQENALDFDGVDDYVDLDQLADDMAGSTDQMIQMWIKCDMNEQTNIRTTFFAINDQTGGNKLIFDVGGLSTQEGKFMIYNALGLAFTSSTIIGDNQCHHILYINSNDHVRIFIDGIFEGDYSSDLVLEASDRYSLGQEYDNLATSDFYNGSIDELSIWNVPYEPTISSLPGSINDFYLGNESGLVGYYKFDQGIPDGSNVSVDYLNDYSPNLNDGDLYGFGLDPVNSTVDAFSNWIEADCFETEDSCFYANELHFDGVDDYLNLDFLQGSLTSSTAFTIEFWMNADLNAQIGTRTSIFAVNNDVGNVNRFMITLGGFDSQDGQIVITDEGAWGTQNDFISDTIVGDEDCHHVAYTRNGSLGSIYIDGELAGTHQIDYLFQSTDVYSVGQEYDDGSVPSQFYNGAINEFRIWDVARTQSEIVGSMNADLNGNEPNLLVYYTFDQGIAGGNNAGANVIDQTPNAYHGLTVGFDFNGQTSNFIEEKCADCTTEDTSSTAGIMDVSAQVEKMVIYPNPATNEVNVLYEVSPESSPILSIVNCLGQEMYSIEYVPNIPVDVSSLPRGIYFILITDKGVQYKSKLMVR